MQPRCVKSKYTLTVSTGFNRVNISQVLLINAHDQLIISKCEHFYLSSTISLS